MNGYQRLSVECPAVRSQSERTPTCRGELDRRVRNSRADRADQELDAVGDENSRRKLQNVVVNSWAAHFQEEWTEYGPLTRKNGENSRTKLQNVVADSTALSARTNRRRSWF